MSLTKASFSMIEGAYINVKDFGAKGDFDPITGVGNDDRASIQLAINYAMTIKGGATVYFPPGNYSTGTGYEVAGNAVIQLLVGSRTVANAANNITLLGGGANIYQGSELSRVLCLSNANNCRVTGLNFYGNMSGAMNLIRATASHLLMIELNSYNCTIDNNYFANGKSWMIHVIGDCLDPSFAQASCPKNITIRNNTLKCRQGNGIKTYAEIPLGSGVYPGTKTPWAIAAIQAEGLFISENIIIGEIDCENNGTSQTFKNVTISNNNFVSGWVTSIPNPALSVSTYWADEETNPEGTAGTDEVQQGVLYNGVGTTDPDPVNVLNNTFEKGLIYFYGNTTSGYPANISNNTFYTGNIRVGWFQGLTPQQTVTSFVTHNNAQKCISTESGFIKIIGNIVQCSFENNNILSEVKPLYDLSEYTDASACKFDGNSFSYQQGDLLAGATKTVTVSKLNPGYPMMVKLQISLLTFGGTGSGYLELTINGAAGATALYTVTEDIRTTYSAVTIGAITKANNSFTFTIQNTGGSAGVYQYTVDGNSPLQVDIA